MENCAMCKNMMGVVEHVQWENHVVTSTKPEMIKKHAQRTIDEFAKMMAAEGETK